MSVEKLVVSRIDSPAGLAEHEAAWDALAVGCGRPYSAPAWMLAWWRHAAPRDASLRALVITEAGQLVAIAPFYVRDTAIGPTYELLASGVASGAEPLAVPGREEEAAHAFADALADSLPAPAAIHFDRLPSGSPWPELFRRTWPGAVRVITEETIARPTLDLSYADFETYIAWRKSAKSRAKLRSRRRTLEERGARYRLLTTREEVEHGLAEFARLHYGRWDDRGGSGALDAQIERMLADVAAELLDSGRFRLFVIDVGGRVISAQLFLAAGGEVSYWLGGFDEDWARFAPGIQTVLAAIEDAFERGDRRLDLGPGAQDYKQRLADGEQALESLTLVTARRRYPMARALQVGRSAREHLSEWVPEPAKRPVRLMRKVVKGAKTFVLGVELNWAVETMTAYAAPFG